MNTTICDDERDGEPQPVGEILEELLAQYEARFPHTVAAQLNFPSSAQINFRYLERRIVPSFQIVASDFDAQ